MDLLSRLLLVSRDGDAPWKVDALRQDLLTLARRDFDDLLQLANLNHVVMRGMKLFFEVAAEAHDIMRADWAQTALDVEQSRIANALEFLEIICGAFREEGLDAIVIKSLDHWPDLGSDLDMYTNARPDEVAGLMKRRFNAAIAQRSWGDRLACKWNFELPGLPEAVEIHVGRLGQTGEQISIASSLIARSRVVEAEGRNFRVPHKSDRLMISTLQRMYRHFYFRLCDVLDSAALVEHEGVDFEDLRTAARKAEIWEGTATYLAIVSDYVKSYRGTAVALPRMVTDSARFGGDAVYYGRGFIRVPILPQSAKLYGTQIAGVLGKGELHAGARLSLLPWLATAAAVGMKITGSDKGVW
jgi:hypothetical protein